MKVEDPIQTPTSSQSRRLLGWQLYRCAPNSVLDPQGLSALTPVWCGEEGPQPAAAAARHGRLEDWWYVCEFRETRANALEVLGVSGVADIYLDGHIYATVSNAYCSHRISVPPTVAPQRVLAIRVRALGMGHSDFSPGLYDDVLVHGA